MRHALRRWAMAVIKRGMELWHGTNGAVEDFVAGEKLVRRAAAAGLRPAMAFCFFCGWGEWGVELDTAQGSALYQAELDGCASETEDSGGACCWTAYLLAWCYNQGLGVDEDGDRTFELLTRAAEVDGNGIAMRRLANIYRHTIVDTKRALSMYKRSAESGYYDGRYELGGILEHGSLGADVDLKQALHWYEKAQEQRGRYSVAITRVRRRIAAQSDSNSDAEDSDSDDAAQPYSNSDWEDSDSDGAISPDEWLDWWNNMEGGEEEEEEEEEDEEGEEEEEEEEEVEEEEEEVEEEQEQEEEEEKDCGS